MSCVLEWQQSVIRSPFEVGRPTVAGIMELSLPGTFVPWNFRFHSQRNVVSLPNTNYDYLIVKLMVVRRYSLFVSLYSFIVVKDGRI